ncbi:MULTISPECIES: nucleoid-associated protein YejK [Alteromonas]|jgi:nucleoid-associated protein|uniref:Nucleoid-associated protein n=1 Tax=Alteromonas stellipolaris TaxID=233316 RepID=A0AAW7Z0L1_9ALTE|nr:MULTISPECIES: nucleoid-associated protein YejK [Alteromonas]AMJ90815.1 nucleoid-associated protein [Alteromonas sp. Mac2]ALM90488.1 Nucleoid-associated protein NdpA [Alteromonas stellipolaris LMG 21856]AMJ74521.1 nucleoid-associated protein [Alteromonas stellipolaris]AMJ86956.1 nucleoid-associated protein [Alteromonas sp. Mac1]AMJ94698.1 nucleoid-associated protein [Alteromonas stellipolaris]
MSALIHHFVVHRLVVNNEDKIEAIPRDNCLAVTPEIELLAHQINHSFNAKPGKGVGHFVSQSDEENTDNVAEFSEGLKNYLTQKKAGGDNLEEEFHSFSLSATKRLVKTLIDTGTVETGFLIFCQYEFLATQYLMIALLNTRSHVEVTNSLDLSAREHLDLARMQLAVRIDLTQWDIQPEQQRYVSFIKGRMGRKVSDFFMQFVGCEELVDVKQQNKQLISSVDAYLASESLDPQEQHQHREEVKTYFKEKIDAGESLSVDELANRLPSNEETSSNFSSFTQSMEVPLEKEIQPDPAALKQLAKFTGQGGGVSVSFERKLMGDRVFYDPATDTLTIRGIPPNLKDQLNRQSSMD